MQLSQFKKPHDIEKIIEYLNTVEIKVNIMEVCGTHTMAIAKSGIKSLLPTNIRLISGPGCPVCVTDSKDIDTILEICKQYKDVIIATYGDMLKVPGSRYGESLEKLRAQGAKVEIVYSALDAVELAKNNPEKNIVFLGIGFETTTPGTVLALEEAIKLGVNNFFIYSMHKLVEPALRALLNEPDFDIDAFLCPGHVGAVIGEEGFEFLVKEFNKPSVICGFEAGDIIVSIYKMVEQIKNNKPQLENEYTRVVKKNGNLLIKEKVEKYLEVSDDHWRGLGNIPRSGLKLKEEYREFDAEKKFKVSLVNTQNENGCQCGEVIKGKIEPKECKLFAKVCSPENPIGPCMVSSEGACAAHYKYLNF